jgi:hypothetical protein
MAARVMTGFWNRRWAARVIDEVYASRMACLCSHIIEAVPVSSNGLPPSSWSTHAVLVAPPALSQDTTPALGFAHCPAFRVVVVDPLSVFGLVVVDVQ